MYAECMKYPEAPSAGRHTTGLICRDTPADELSAGVLAAGRCRQPDGTTRVVDLLSEAPPTSFG
jgi:hypothetical protein